MAKSKINFGRKKVFLENLSKYLTLPLNEDSKYLLSLSPSLSVFVAIVCFVKEIECALGLIVGLKFVIVIVIVQDLQCAIGRSRMCPKVCLSMIQI